MPTRYLRRLAKSRKSGSRTELEKFHQGQLLTRSNQTMKTQIPFGTRVSYTYRAKPRTGTVVGHDPRHDGMEFVSVKRDGVQPWEPWDSVPSESVPSESVKARKT